MNEKSRGFHPVLAVLTVLFMFVQAFCMTAFGAESREVCIPAGTETAEVNRILTEELVPDSEGTLEWEYRCEGKEVKTGVLKNTAWGSVGGFESTKKVFTTYNTYVHPALSENQDGTYQVRAAGTEYTIKKAAKHTVDVKLLSNQEARLRYHEDGTVDPDATKEEIFTKVFSASNADVLSSEEVEMEYYATAESGAVGSLGMNWMPLEGGKKVGLTYPAISEGKQKIRISWEGNDDYFAFEEETTVTMTGREKAEYTLNDPVRTVKLVYNEDQTVDYSGINEDIFNAVIETSDVFGVNDVTIEYHATAKSGAIPKWVPLTGDDTGTLVYPAISKGDQNVRISWPGDEDYDAVKIEATVTVADRDAMKFNLKEAPYEVGLVFSADQSIDYDAMAKVLYEAIVESTEPEVEFDEVTVEYNAGQSGLIENFKPLGYESLVTKKFDQGNWKIRISWGGNKDYAPGSVTVSDVKVSDNRISSTVVLKDGISFSYSKDVTAMKQAVLDSVIDWEHSELPAKETLAADDFTFTYHARLSVLDGLSSEIGDTIADKILNGEGIWDDVPFEGKSYEVAGNVLGSFPQIGAGEQKIQVRFNGNSEYRSSEKTEGTVTINKANVKIHVNSASRYVSEAVKGAELVSTDPEDEFDLYVIYAGITSNVTTGIALELPEKYTTNSTVIKIIDKVLAGLGQPTLTEMLQNGITVGELRKLLNASEVIDALEKIGVDTGSLGQVITVINKLPAIGDNLRISIGTPKLAGIYTVTAVTDNKNYNTGVGVGALVLKADKAKLVWNQSIGKKISAADAANADFGAHLEIGGTAVADQSSVSVLYSGFTSKWKAYSSTTTPPTEPGRYTMTVVVLGGNYLASPINRSFQITK